MTTAGYTGSIVALALHKRSQVHLGDSATFVSTARNQYAQCYTGWGSWDAINAACKATFVTTAAGLNCAWHAL